MIPLSWIPVSKGTLSPSTFSEQIDLADKELYAFRGTYKGCIIPGRLGQDSKCLVVGHNGNEIEVTDYEVLVGPKNELEWVKVDEKWIPPNAVQGGNNLDRVPYYIGRVDHDGVLTTGKVHQTYGLLYITHHGSEHVYSSFEVLVKRERRYSLVDELNVSTMRATVETDSGEFGTHHTFINSPGCS